MTSFNSKSFNIFVCPACQVQIPSTSDHPPPASPDQSSDDFTILNETSFSLSFLMQNGENNLAIQNTFKKKCGRHCSTPQSDAIGIKGDNG